jgi:metallophosphoesterase superfamily enzyme
MHTSWVRDQRTVAIGDAHFPFVSERALFELFKLMRDFKPRRIIQLGDLYDFFSHGRFPRPLSITPRMEVTEGRKMAKNFWKQIRSEFPDAELFQILGNHDDRPHKQMIAKLPEMEPFFDIAGMWQFDGVKTTYDSKQELIIDGVCYLHGHKKFGAHVAHNLMPTVAGHSHTGGVHFMSIRDQLLWELNAGYIGDPTQGPLMYREQKWAKWTHGCGIIDSLGPRFCPL